MTEQRAAAPLPPADSGRRRPRAVSPPGFLPPFRPGRRRARLLPSYLSRAEGRGEERTRHESGTAVATLARAQPRRKPSPPPTPRSRAAVNGDRRPRRSHSLKRPRVPPPPAAGRARRTPRPRYLSRGLLSASLPPVTGRCEDGGSAVQIPGERRRAATGRGRGRPSRGKGLGGRPPGARLLSRRPRVWDGSGGSPIRRRPLVP